MRIVKRAGFESWSRIFHALRSSRETELARDFPLHVVTAWLGNTLKIAMRHYLLTTEADFERATTKKTKPELAVQIPVQQDDKRRCNASQSSCEKCEISRQNETLHICATCKSGEDRIV
jgi:hypothetical protein